MQINRVDEVLLVVIAAGPVFHSLNLNVDRSAGSVRNLVSQVGDNVLKSPFQHARHFQHRPLLAPHRPVLPPTDMLSLRPFIRVAIQHHRRLVQCPCPRHLQPALSQLVESPPVLRLRRRPAAQPVVARPVRQAVACNVQSLMLLATHLVHFLS